MADNFNSNYKNDPVVGTEGNQYETPTYRAETERLLWEIWKTLQQGGTGGGGTMLARNLLSVNAGYVEAGGNAAKDTEMSMLGFLLRLIKRGDNVKPALSIKNSAADGGAGYLQWFEHEQASANDTYVPVFSFFSGAAVGQNLPGSTQSNYTWAMGYNLNSNGTPRDNTKGAIGLGFEAFYLQGGAGVPAQEFHIFHNWAGGGGTRFITFFGRQDGSYSSMQFQASEIFVNAVDSTPNIKMFVNSSGGQSFLYNHFLVQVTPGSNFLRAFRTDGFGTLSLLRYTADREMELGDSSVDYIRSIFWKDVWLRGGGIATAAPGSTGFSTIGGTFRFGTINTGTYIATNQYIDISIDGTTVKIPIVV